MAFTEAPDGGGARSSGSGTMDAAPLVLVAEDIQRNFGAVVAVANATIQLREGETLGLVGDNGAGKSTLLKSWPASSRPMEGASC